MKSLIEIEKKIIPVLKKYKVTRAGFFGSYARGEERRKSDVDILVELDEGFSLLDVIGIKIELEESVGKKIDLVEYGTIRKELRDTILGEEVSIIL
jgi:hypothetical protein